jgi:hypothetical protein
MAVGTLFYLTIFVIGRERGNPIQAVAEQTILPSFQGMRDSGPSWLILGRDFFTLLGHTVTEETVVRLPRSMALRIRRNSLPAVAVKTASLLAFDQVGYTRHGEGLAHLITFHQGRLMAQGTQRLVISRVVFWESDNRFRTMTGRAVSSRHDGMGHRLRLA